MIEAMNPLTVADLFVRAIPTLPTLEPPTPVPPGTRCALSGAPITAGYRALDLVTAATAEFLDVFRGGVGGWVGEAAARCFRSANPRGGKNPLARSWLVFEDGTAWAPMIAREAATADRPAWTDLVRAVWPHRAGQRMAAILTTDTRKRLWPRARVGALGPCTPLLLYDGSPAAPVAHDAPVIINWPILLRVLDLVEAIYARGVGKPSLWTSLLSPSAITALGLREAIQLERALASWRARAEFRIAVLIAQRPLGTSPDAGSEPEEDADAV